MIAYHFQKADTRHMKMKYFSSSTSCFTFGEQIQSRRRQWSFSPGHGFPGCFKPAVPRCDPGRTVPEFLPGNAGPMQRRASPCGAARNPVTPNMPTSRRISQPHRQHSIPAQINHLFVFFDKRQRSYSRGRAENRRREFSERPSKQPWWSARSKRVLIAYTERKNKNLIYKW